MERRRFQKGQVLAEVLIAIGIFAIAITSIISVIFLSARTGKESVNLLLASRLAQEYQEAANSISLSSWSTFSNASTSPNDHYTFSISNNAWQFTYVGTSTETVTLEQKTFNRHAYFETVQRNSSGDIVSSGGTADPATLKMTVIVTWPTGRQEQSYYLTRWSNEITNQTIWQGGKGQTGPIAFPNDKFLTSTQVFFATSSGIIRICKSGESCD